MTNISRLAVVLGLLFSIISISTSGVAQPPPPPYTHYKIINAEVQGQLVVGAPVTIVAVIQDMGNVESSSGTYEIYINRTPVDYRTIYLSSGGSTTVRYTHYFDSSGTYSIDIVTCSELGSCPDDRASGTISIKDSSAPPQPPPLPPSPPSNQPPWATIAAPSEVKVGETFWVEIIDYGDDQPNPLVFEYDFGDDRRVRSPGAERHSYSQAGTYTIRGRVCDPQGACSNTNSVTVRVISNQQTPPPSQQYVRFTGTLTNVSEAVSDVGYWLLYTVRPDSSYGLGSEVMLRVGPVSCAGGRGQIEVSYVSDIGSRVEVYSTTDWDVSCAPAYIRKISSPPPPPDDRNRPPSVTLNCYPLTLTPNDTLSCEANASDPNGDPLTYEWFLNGQKLTNISSSSNRVYWDKPQPGSYTLKVVVSDNKGGTNQASVSFTVRETQQNKPPVIQSIEYDPSRPVTGQLVRFWANAYDENGRIVAYEWDFGARPYQTEEQAEFAWLNPGTYRVCLTVYDNDGASTRKCRDITVQEARTLLPPRANFTFSPSNPKVGEVVYFRDQSDDPDGRVEVRGWFVNEQFFSGDPNPTTTFQYAGTYTICLQVVDNDSLNNEKCTTITVLPEDKPKQTPVARFTITAPTGQTIQENGELRLTVNKGQTILFNFSASNSYDPDGGGIRAYQWWINGTPVSQSSEFSYPLAANAPEHKIQLRVTDDEGQTAEVGARIIITEEQTPLNSCWSGSRLSNSALAELAKQYFPDDVVPETGEKIRVTAYAVARAESGGNPTACGDNNQSIGLWQIYLPAHPRYDRDRLFDSNYNAQAAKEISNNGTYWKPWCTWEKTACGGNGNLQYRQYLEEARQALGITTPGQTLLSLKAPWTAGITAIVGGPGSFYGENFHVGNIYYSIDFNWDNDDGSPVRAAADGTIKEIGYKECGKGGYGNYVIIDHGNGFTTLYAHLKYDPKQDHGIQQNQRVEQGWIIGFIGSTPGGECSSGPHLHFELRKDDKTVMIDSIEGIAIKESCQGTTSCVSDGGKITSTNVPTTPQDRTLVRAQGDYKVYWLQNGKRYWVYDMATLDAMKALPNWGWDSSPDRARRMAHEFPSSALNRYREGPCIRLDIQNEKECSPKGLLVRQKGTDPVYVVEGGQLRRVQFEEFQVERKFDWKDVIEITSEAFPSLGTVNDAIQLPPTTKTIEQAIASLVPNDPSDVANPDLVIGDIEMTKALGFYEKQQPVPNTDGKIIDDATMLRLQDLWISRRAVSAPSGLTTSETRLRREWGLLTRQLDRRTIEFIALGFDVRSIRVEIFNLQGQRVFAEEAPSNRLTFRGQDSRGQRLANGVYLYVVTVRNRDGTIQRSDVRKLVLRR